jgi:hypothetical protein
MEELKPYLASLTQYMINSGMELAPLPKVIFKNDKINAEDVLSRTAHYNPNNNSITLFISKRHPKDILRSYAHEMIHHNQNLENRLNNISTTNINEDDYLKEIEREAYEKGNMIFRGWENQYKQNIKENKMTVKELRKLIREAIYNELEVKNEDPSTLKPAIVFDNNKKQHFISLVDKNGKVNSLGPLISEADVKKVNAGDTNDFCKKANQLYSNLDENAILENTNLKVVKIVDSCKLDENKHKNVSLLNLANEYVAEHGDVTPEELAKGLKIDLKTAKKLVMDLEDDFKNYYGNEEDLTEDLSSDIVNLDKQIDNLTKQISPLQKKKADLEKQKADKSKIKADQDVKSAALTTESKGEEKLKSIKTTTLNGKKVEPEFGFFNGQLKAYISTPRPNDEYFDYIFYKVGDVDEKGNVELFPDKGQFTEETANATGTGATMNSGTGEQYATPKAFKLKLKKK